MKKIEVEASEGNKRRPEAKVDCGLWRRVAESGVCEFVPLRMARNERFTAEIAKPISPEVFDTKLLAPMDGEKFIGAASEIARRGQTHSRLSINALKALPQTGKAVERRDAVMAAGREFEVK